MKINRGSGNKGPIFLFVGIKDKKDKILSAYRVLIKTNTPNKRLYVTLYHVDYWVALLQEKVQEMHFFILWCLHTFELLLNIAMDVEICK